MDLNLSPRSLMALGAAAGLCTAAAGASATPIRYEFTAFSSPVIRGETFSGSFSVDLPNFVMRGTTVSVADLTSCTVVVSPPASVKCGEQDFMGNFDGTYPGLEILSFGVQTELNPGTGIFYAFDEGAFGTLGTHESVLTGEIQEATGRLVVTAVPESSSWALIALGLVGVGFATRRTSPSA